MPDKDGFKFRDLLQYKSRVLYTDHPSVVGQLAGIETIFWELAFSVGQRRPMQRDKKVKCPL